MNLATLAKSQTLATLLQALAPATELVAGRTVEARLIALAGDGTATAQVGSDMIALVLAGPAAKQAALQPGATLVLRLDAAEEPGAGLRATLVEVRPPSASSSPSGTPAPTAAATPAPALPGQPAAGAASSALPSQPQPGTASQASATQPATLRAEATAALGSTAAPLPGTPTAAQAASPRTVAGPLLGPALAGQDSLAPLLANMRALADGSVSLTLPRPLLTLIDGEIGRAHV